MLGVIVLNWNGGEGLVECLKSVYASEDCGAEIVVYVPDNASTDGSIDAVGREFPPARVIQNGGNLGFSGGNNPGWRQAVADGAEWVFFLNNDAVVAPDCLRRMLEVCRANPQIGAACPTIYYGTPQTHPDGKSSPDSRPEIWFEKGVCDFEVFCGVNHAKATPEERSSTWYETDWCTGCCFLTTAKLLETTGGFDEGFFAYCEDTDLSLKIRAEGRVCVMIPSAVSWHKVGQSTSKEPTPGYVFYIGRNTYYLAERHAPRPDVWAKFQRVYRRQIMTLTFGFLNSGKRLMGETILQGYHYAIRGHKGIRPSRKPGLALKSAARLIQGVYKVRNQLRRKPDEPAVALAGQSPV